jgi:oligoendopeptidase F
MLLNYNDTLESVFTLAHELGHTIHTLLAYENQPYATADYTIFVAEVPSTLHEALLLDYLLERSDDPLERAALLVHAIDSISGTFYAQSMFADFELRAHRLVEQGQPITADALREVYSELAKQHGGPAVSWDPLYGATWSRISHFFEAPFYVYQYSTCYASSAQLHRELTGADPALRADAVRRFRTLLESGGNDHPMEQLRTAGIDLTEVSTFQAVIDQLDGLVTRLETEIERL